MNNRAKIKSSQQSSCYIPHPFFKNSKSRGHYEFMFFEDFSRHFSIILRNKNDDFRDFFCVKSDDDALKRLLEYDGSGFLKYDFDNLLSRNLFDLINYGKAYVEVVKLFDEHDLLVGIKFVPFRNTFQVKIGKKYFFVLRKIDGRFIHGIIKAENVIPFYPKEFGFNRCFFKRLSKKYKRIQLPIWTSPRDEKAEIDYKAYDKMKDYRLLKYGKKVRWLGRNYGNYYLNEPYLLYWQLEERKLKEMILSKFVIKYNEMLAKVGQVYGFSGEICYDSCASNYDELYQDLEKGIKTCKQVSDEFIGKFF